MSFVEYRINEGTGTEIKGYDINGDEIPAPELVSNGDFDTGIEGWTPEGASTFTWNPAGFATGVRNQQAVANYQLAEDLEIGTEYILEYDILRTGNAALYVYFIAGGVQDPNSASQTGTGTKRFEFIAGNASRDIVVLGGGTASDFDIDNVTLKKSVTGTVTPDASWAKHSRLDYPHVYNADASGPFGYLSESAGTNLPLWSEDFTSAFWPNDQSAATADAGVAPDGTSTADRLEDDGINTNYCFTSQTILVASGDSCFSVYAKADGSDFIVLALQNFDAGASGLTYFDIASGTVGTANANNVDEGVEAVGNGWYRCWVAFNTTTDLSGTPRIYVADADASTVITATSSVLIWGAQCEAGTFPTSYIKTEAATVTRSADSLLYSDTDNISDLAGTAKCEASTLWSVGSGLAMARDSNGRMFEAAASPSTRFRSYDGSTLAASTSGTSMEGAPQALALAWGDNMTAYYNGVAGTGVAYDGTIGSGDVGVGCYNNGSAQWNGTIRLLEIHSSEGKV